MHTLEILKQVSERELTPDEESQLMNDLSAAYHSDEAAMSSRDIQRIAEKISAKLKAN